MSAHRAALDKLEEQVAEAFGDSAARLRRCLEAGGKVLVCGNGGSAADAQHFAAELTGGRTPRSALALTVDTSALTALANDHGYDDVFSRQLRALGRPGDVLVALSTSGRSRNVLEAVSAARKLSIATIGLTGEGGGELASRCDLCLRVPSNEVARIQEMHMLLLHALWEALESPP